MSDARVRQRLDAADFVTKRLNPGCNLGGLNIRGPKFFQGPSHELCLRTLSRLHQR